LRDHAEEFARRNVKIVVISFESSSLARSYVEETFLPWPLLIDDKRETYRNYGFLSASFWDIWGAKTWWVYLTEILKGEKIRKPEGDIFQRGGDVLIDPNGIVRLHHTGKGPADRPNVDKILKMINVQMR
jgi:peroxiredoxin